jgi:hypothetical protein
MFDTNDNKVSENGSCYKSENIAEDFAEKRGFLIAIKTDVTEIIYSQYFNDGSDNSMSVLHNEPIEETIHNQGYTYVKNEYQKRKLVGRSERDVSGNGWDILRYRVIKIEEGKRRDFSGANRIHKIKGPIDEQNENK